MSNVGPIDDAQQQRTGKEFINELFDEEEELLQTNREIETNVEQSLSSKDMSQLSNQEAEQSGNQMPDGNVKYPEETSKFQVDNRDIILNLSKYTLRRIVMLICDEAGFLLEQKLVNLLQPLEKNEKSMVKLDSIFKALGVETENDVKLLAQYFVNHRNYKELINEKAYTQQLETDDADLEKEVNEKIVPLDLVELVHPNEVITALKTFATLNQKSDNKKKLAKFSLSSLNDRNDSADGDYWKKYENLIDDKKNKLWDGVLYSLQKYQ